MLSRFVIAFLPRIKRFNFLATVTICRDFGAQECKTVTVSIFSPSICHEVIGLFMRAKGESEKAGFHPPLSLHTRQPASWVPHPIRASDPPLVWTPASDPLLVWTLPLQIPPWSGLSLLRPSPRTPPWPPVGGLRGLLSLMDCQLSHPFWAAGVLNRAPHSVNSVPAPAVPSARSTSLDSAY